jgi:bifunctional oligoribonuclease and PAP phosphatase NrnA
MMMMMMTSCDDPAPYQHLKTALSAAKSVLIAPHVSPDGDTLGSGLVMYHAIKHHFPNVQVLHPVIAGTVPEIYEFLPGFEAFINLETNHGGVAMLDQYDVAISCDCGAIERLGPARQWFDTATTSVNIDHHLSNGHFATINIVETNAAASGEVVANILDAWNVPISRDMAEALYVTLLTDTGGFRFSSTSAKIFRLAARLLDTGIDPAAIYKTIYENRPKAQALLHAQGVEQAQFNSAGTMVWTTVTQAQLATLGAKEEYMEGLIDCIREIHGIRVAAVLKETKDGQAKVSLRSNDKRINVAALLSQFGGGGHHAAAGASMAMPLQAACEVLLPVLESALVEADKHPAIA